LVGVQSLLCGEVRRRSGSIEVAEACKKRGFTPVCLDESTSSCPIIRIPKARVDGESIENLNNKHVFMLVREIVLYYIEWMNEWGAIRIRT
jgi:hypothetical protein